jgi:hypothetical protein
MDVVDLRAYLLALSTQGQESFRGVLKRDRTIRKSIPADTLEMALAPWSEVVDALMLDPELERRTLRMVVRLQQIARNT